MLKSRHLSDIGLAPPSRIRRRRDQRVRRDHRDYRDCGADVTDVSESAVTAMTAATLWVCTSNLTASFLYNDLSRDISDQSLNYFPPMSN